MSASRYSTSALAIVVSMALAACGADKERAPSEPSPGAGAATSQAVAIPASLAPFGDGYPSAGDPCRRLGESAATVNFLDHTAILVGCPTAEAAAALGGNVVDTIEGITLVSIPTGDASAGPAEMPPGESPDAPGEDAR